MPLGSAASKWSRTRWKWRTFLRLKNTRATYLNRPSVRCGSLYPEADLQGVWGGDGVYRRHTFNELKLLLVNLKSSIRSLWPCSVLIILSDRIACEKCFIASSCCWKLDSPPGGLVGEAQVSYQSWRRQWLGTQSVSWGGKRGHFTIPGTWGHVIYSPSSAELGRFIIKPLQLWSAINTPD